MTKTSILDTFELLWKCKLNYEKLHEMERVETENYLNNAIKFFEKIYNCKVKCKIQYYAHGSFMYTGAYYPVENKLVIYGLSIHTNRELAGTMFHELVHYWQHQIVKTMTAVDVNHELRQSGTGYSKRKKKNSDIRIFYRGVDTSLIEYENQPHEIEARELSIKLNKEYEAAI